jgi:alkylation response protein AidB-like acyl-CoA dehydrogenase
MGGFLRSALTAEEAAFLDGAAAFTAKTVAQHANEWERSRRQPVEALREAAALGLLRLETPKAEGGLGHRYLVKLALCEEMSRRSCRARSSAPPP